VSNPAGETWHWATVTQADPLRVKLDGDAAELLATPEDLVGGLAVGNRVWVQRYGRRLQVVGKLGGPLTGDVAVGGDATVAGDVYANEVRQNNPTRGGGHVNLLTTNNGDPAVWFSNTSGAPSDRPRIIGQQNLLNIYAGTPGTATGVQIMLHNPLRYAGRPESTFTANLGIATTPVDVVYKLTSSARAKLMIEPVSTPPERILDVEPRDWYDRNEAEEYAAYLSGERELEDINDQPFRRVPGLVAEELEAAGLEQFVTYEPDPDNEGQQRTAGVMYDRAWTLLIPLVRELRQQVAELQDKVEQLEADS
jgi:hypothetical protein